MKKALWGLGIVVAGAAIFGLGWLSHSGPDKTAAAAASPHVAVGNPYPNTPPPPDPRVVTQDEWQQLRAVRDATLQANPDLAAEYKQLVAEMQAQQAKFDAAMIKADPKVAPLVAKLVALRERSMAHMAQAAAGPR